MTEELLYLGGKLVQVNPDTISRTLQINNFSELKDRQSNRSNTIKLPDNAHNRQVLDNLGIVGNNSNKPYENIDCKYVVDGVELIQKGYAIIKRFQSNIELVIYDGNVDLRESLQGKKLNELDWTDWNHQLSFDSYIASFDNDEGYIYANGRFYIKDDVGFEGNLVDAIDIKSPSFYVHTLFDMIITQAGFTWSGDIQQDEDFNNRLTSMNNGYDRNIINEGGNGGTEFNASINDDYIRSDQNNDFLDENVIGSFVATGGNNTLDLDGTFNDQNSDAVRFEVHVDGVGVAIYDLTGLTNSETIDHTISFSTQPGDSVEFIILGFAKDLGNTTYIVQYQYDFTIKVVYVPFSEKYVLIDFAQIVGEDSQLSFVKDIMQRYGLIYQRSQFENHLEFRTISGLFIDRINADDWSDKLVSIEEEEYTPPYNRFNFANYQYDQDVVPFANGTLSFENDTIPFSGDLFSSIFKASTDRLFPFNPNTQLFIIRHWIVSEDENDQVVENNNDGLRFFKLIYRNESHDYQFSDDANSQNFTGEVPTLLFDDETSYQYYLDTYYAEFKKAFNKYQMVTATMKLTLFDVYKLNFLKLRYISHLGHYYYINKIPNHRPDRLSKVELIRVSNG